MNNAVLTGNRPSTRPLLWLMTIGLVMQVPGALAAEVCDFDRDGVESIACGGTDCDDADPNTFPGNAEVCDASHHDEDCDPLTFGFRDTDNDSFADANCCNDSGGGNLHCGEDCNDLARTIHPLASDFCNGVDDNCDTFVDDASQSPGANAFFVDNDSDGYGVAASGVFACVGDPGFAVIGGDCDDANPAVVPGAILCGQGPTAALVCRNDGRLVAAACGDGAVCVSQPNGLGVCQLEKPKKVE